MRPSGEALTWTVPGGQSWRDLKYLDLRLANDTGIALWARFLGGQNALALLDAGGNIIAEGLPGSAGLLDSVQIILCRSAHHN